MGKTTTQRNLWKAPLWVGFIALASCATERPPIDALSTADMAINRALDAKAAQLAPLDLRIARDKLELAKANMAEEEYTFARRLAEEARVDARVAEARAKAQGATENAQELQKTMRSFQNDIEQKSHE